MSTQTPVLDGNRLYGAVTYSDNNDPQTLTASLGDSTSMSEADVFSGTKPLSDSATLSDAVAKLVEMMFADSSTLTEARILKAIKVLSDSTTLADVRTLSAAKTFVEAMTLAETWKTQGTKALAESSSMTEAFLKTVSRAFGDTTTLVDASALATNRPLADSLSFSDSTSRIVTKVLSDITTSTFNLYAQPLYGGHTYSGDFTAINIYMRDAISREILKLLSESISVNDSAVAIQQTKGFTEFILLKSWLRMDLRRVPTWAITFAAQAAESSITLYDKSLYGGVRLYAASPKVIWENETADLSVWQKAVEITQSQLLYAKTGYGNALYATQPSTVWNKLSGSAQAWTNEDGQNLQES